MPTSFVGSGFGIVLFGPWICNSFWIRLKAELEQRERRLKEQVSTLSEKLSRGETGPKDALSRRNTDKGTVLTPQQPNLNIINPKPVSGAQASRPAERNPGPGARSEACAIAGRARVPRKRALDDRVAAGAVIRVQRCSSIARQRRRRHERVCAPAARGARRPQGAAGTAEARAQRNAGSARCPCCQPTLLSISIVPFIHPLFLFRLLLVFSLKSCRRHLQTQLSAASSTTASFNLATACPVILIKTGTNLQIASTTWMSSR